MKLILGTALAVGVVLGAGQTMATNLVDDEITVVEEVPTSTDDVETTSDADDPADPADESGEESEEASGEGSGADDAAVVNYGQLVNAWVHCTHDAQETEAEEGPLTEDPVEPSTEEPVTDCGDRPHPPGNAVGWDAAHSKEHGKKADDSESEDSEESESEESAVDEDTAVTHGKGHPKKGKGSHKH